MQNSHQHTFGPILVKQVLSSSSSNYGYYRHQKDLFSSKYSSKLYLRSFAVSSWFFPFLNYYTRKKNLLNASLKNLGL